MEENCLICYDKCQPYFNLYLANNPLLKSKISSFFCEFYKLSNSQLFQEAFNCCQPCFDGLTRVQETWSSLNELQKRLRTQKEELDNKIRTGLEKYPNFSGQNPVLNSIRSEILKNDFGKNNTEKNTEPEVGGEEMAAGDLDIANISYEIPYEEELFSLMGNSVTSPESILGDNYDNEEEEERDMKPNMTRDFEMPLKLELKEESFPGSLLKEPVLILERIPINLNNTQSISIQDPSIQSFIERDQSLFGHQLNEDPRTHPLKCSLCPRRFKSNKGLHRHEITIHNPEEKSQKYPCSMCSRSFKSLPGLKQHKNTAHRSNDNIPLSQQSKCPFCDEFFRNIHALRRHKKFEHPNARHLCPVVACKREFYSARHLELHRVSAHQKSGNSERIPESDVKVKCHFCPLILNNKWAFYRHKRKFHSKAMYICPVESCKKEFSMFKSLEFHEKGSHSIKAAEHPSLRITHPLKCSLCPQRFKSNKGLHRHEITLHNPEYLSQEPLHPCSMCSRSFKSLPGLKQHKSTVHRSNTNIPLSHQSKCPLCGEYFRNFYALQRHRKFEHPAKSTPKEYKCMDCNLTFDKGISFYNHWRTHPENNFICPVETCGKNFYYRSILEGHLRMKHGAGNERETHRHNCPEPGCGKKFPTMAALKQHSTQVHDGRVHKCPREGCPRIYKSEGGLKAHLQAHDGRTFLCEICSKSFTLRSTLENHQKVMHPTSEKEKFICDVCGKPFTNVFYMREHKKEIHEKAFRHFCEVCGQGFYSRGKLTQHLKIHFKKFTCSFCPKMFATIGCKKYHEISHSEDRPFICSLCKKAFKRKKEWEDHIILLHTSNENLQGIECKKCGQSFKIMKYFHAHKKKCPGSRGTGEGVPGARE